VKRNIKVMPCSTWADHLIGLHPASLSYEERRILEQHLEVCSACAAVFRDYRALDERIHHALSDPTVVHRP